MTRPKLIELIRRRLAEGDPTINDAVQDAELWITAASAMAEALKREMLQIQYGMDGGSLPTSAMVATYEGENAIEVERGNGSFCRVQLPVTPMNIPENAGLVAMYPSGRPLEQFIPLPPGIYALWMGVPLLSDFMDILYTAEQRYADIFADIIGMGITTVDMKIVTVDVMAIDAEDDSTPLPIGADLTIAIIERVCKFYMPPGRGEDNGGYDKEPNPAQQPQ